MSMAPISPGPESAYVRRSKKKAQPTQTKKLHRYESFTKRISKLKIDPIHALDKRHNEEVSDDLAHSFFRASLEEWAELNLSQTFTTFLNKANPLCENLPQLLHHSDKIFDLLLHAIEKQDALALEPLLSLLAHLAHDLGRRFEACFSRTVEVVSKVAAAHEKAEVVEWCFTCLAWMFKYLSRLLVEDMRPLLNVMTPYLSNQKEYIVRFSAEALAFLLKKAALLYSKRRSPLQLAVHHLFEKLTTNTVEESQISFRFGIMNLCVESARGIEYQLHSSAPHLVRCLLDRAEVFIDHEIIQSTISGILICLIHDTDDENFNPVLEIVLESCQRLTASQEHQKSQWALGLLQLVIGTRKGSRISSWSATIQAFLNTVDGSTQKDWEDLKYRQTAIGVAAQTLQYAPMDQLLSHSERLLGLLATKLSSRDFLSLCAVCAKLGQERFVDFLFPRFQQFITDHWKTDTVSLYYTLEEFRENDITSKRSGAKNCLSCPSELGTYILQHLVSLSKKTTSSSIEDIAGQIHIAKNTQLAQDAHYASQFRSTMGILVGSALRENSNDPDVHRQLLLGWGLDMLLDVSQASLEDDRGLILLALAGPSINFRMPSFLSAVNRLLERCPMATKSQSINLANVRRCLVQNLLSSSPDLKTESLRLLSSIGPPGLGVDVSETTDLMLEILVAPYTPTEVRNLTMLLRKLPQRHASLAADADLHDIIPLFCLGLLPQFHDTTRKEICTILAQLVEDSTTEETVLNIIVQWLQTPSSLQQPKRAEPETNRDRPTPFECTSLSSSQEVCNEVMKRYMDTTSSFRAIIEDAHKVETSSIPPCPRALALQVLSSMPTSVERRSRLIVPIFLSAPMNRAQLSLNSHSDTSTSSHTLTADIDDHEWSFVDRKTFLLLFSKFTNPRVLYRSQEVSEKLLDLLSNGNAEIRKLALQAILKWKDTQIKPYEEILLSVVEEKKTSSDLAQLLTTDGELGIKSSDRIVILPILLRLIFGLIVGRSGTAGSQEARRKAILRSVFRMDSSGIATFLDIALGQLRTLRVAQFQSEDAILNQCGVPEDQQYGFLRLLLSILEIHQSQFSPYGQQVVDAVVICVLDSSLRQQSTITPAKSISALSRNIRRIGLQCLVLLTEHCPDIDWTVFLPPIFANTISPRLENFASETSQGISGFLRLFATWVHSHKLVRHLRDQDTRIPGVLWQCLVAESAQLDVKVFILEEIVTPWLSLAEHTEVVPNTARDFLDIESSGLLTALTANIERTPPKGILNAVTSILPPLAKFASSAESKQKAVLLLTNLLRGPEYKLSPDIKSKLILSIQSFLQEGKVEVGEETRVSLWELTSSLFNFFKDHPNRLILCRMLELLAHGQKNASLEVAQYCLDLNADSLDRLDEPDYDKRFAALQDINSLPTTDDYSQLWLPIVYNLLFFVRTVEDFAIRSNSLACLKQFIVRAAASDSASLKDLLAKVVLPAALKGCRDQSELIRADFVTIYGLLVQHLRDDENLADMVVLLVGGDEEASFFSNILHIQQHRRLRAIRRLTSEVETGAISSVHIAEFFIPLLEMFAYDSSGDESMQGTKGQSIAAMSVLLQWVDWKHFKMFFRKYKNDINNINGQKDTVKLLGHAADALLNATTRTTQEQSTPETKTHLAKSIRQNSALENEIKSQFIPRLTDLVHYKDETEISFRIPIAVTSIKLIKMLPADEIAPAAGPIILDIANILRSRVQESRDIARNTLAQIVTLLGASSVQFVVKELRNALTRGYQLHVLSYTVHAILVALAPTLEDGELDYCVADLIGVAIDDIFGAVGQEKDNQDYISTMKEVKGSKSFDTVELVARSTSVTVLMKLIAPIQTILSGTLTTKQVRQVDEWLRRVGLGISRNPAARERDLLVFSYQLIEAFYKQKSDVKRAAPSFQEKARQRFLVQFSSEHKSTTGLTAPLLYKLARFAIDLVRSTLQKHDHLLTPENIHGFLPIIGDTLIEAQEDVKISAMRLLSAIAKLPMPELERNAPLYFMEAVKVVKNSTSTNEEGAQAALKLVATILRERKSVKVRDTDVAALLHRVTPDIEEPDRQGVTFNFIRAVMSRKIQVSEIYDLVDKIGLMMITNHARGARDAARGVYVHFILEYPQSSSRWGKQQKFLLKNLEYEHPEGRQSVMEAINTLVQKLKGETGEEFASSLFMPVLLRVANDENQRCRESAGALLGQLFKSANHSQIKDFLEPMQSWLQQEENHELQKISLQAYSVLLTSNASIAEADLRNLQRALSELVEMMSNQGEDEWELLFQILVVISNLVQARPGLVLGREYSGMWSQIWHFLDHPNGWIQSSVASLLDAFTQTCSSSSEAKMPLKSRYGLVLKEDALLRTLKASVRILKRIDSSEKLRLQISQNLLYYARVIDANKVTMEVSVKKQVNSNDEMDTENINDSEDEDPEGTTLISGIQYIFDQMARILRLEINYPKTSALLPKISAVELLVVMIPGTAIEYFTNETVQAILLPLQHLTDTNTIAPRSADPSFAATYQKLVENAHEAMDMLQRRIGDSEYVKALTDVSKTVRRRREERRTKRRIERVAEPERAARGKKRKADRKKERKKEMGRSFQRRRVEGGM